MAKNTFLEIYNLLQNAFGRQNWWPAETVFEMVVGAVLTQNTNWSNVCKALNNLKKDHLLSFEKMVALPVNELAELIRPSGYYNIKAKRLSNLLQMIQERYDGELDHLFSEDTDTARYQLLSVRGIGPETADSILLYGGNHPVFVVDAYTHRIFSRHTLIEEESDYYSIQQAFLEQLPQDADLFSEYHALLVHTGKNYCKKSKPLCNSCPLNCLFDSDSSTYF